MLVSFAKVQGSTYLGMFEVFGRTPNRAANLRFVTYLLRHSSLLFHLILSITMCIVYADDTQLFPHDFRSGLNRLQDI